MPGFHVCIALSFTHSNLVIATDTRRTVSLGNSEDKRTAGSGPLNRIPGTPAMPERIMTACGSTYLIRLARNSASSFQVLPSGCSDSPIQWNESGVISLKIQRIGVPSA